jgi:hypothetical protein
MCGAPVVTACAAPQAEPSNNSVVFAVGEVRESAAPYFSTQLIAGILADLVFWPTPDGRPHFYEMD